MKSTSNTSKASNTSNSSNSSIKEIDFDFENIDNIQFKDIKVFNTITLNTPEINTNNSLDKLIPVFENLTSKRTSIQEIQVLNTLANNNYTTNFILDCAATRHIVSNKEYFYSFKQCNKQVN